MKGFFHRPLWSVLTPYRWYN